MGDMDNCMTLNEKVNGSETESQASTTRRNALRVIGAGGATITGSGLLVSPTSASRSDETVTITTVKVGNEPRVQKEVPADWWNYEERAERVKEQLRAQYRDISAIEGVGLGVSHETIADKKKSTVTVQVDPETGTNVDIPSAVGDVPIEVIDATRPELDACYDDSYDFIPGGVVVGNAMGGVGTATCPVTASNGEKRLMTCGHLFDDCYDDLTDYGLYQSGQYVGPVVDNSIKQDWLTAKRDQYSDVEGFDNTIVDTNARLAGRVTYSGLKDLKSDETTVYKKGRRTCKTEGLVKQLDVKVGRCTCDSGCDVTSENYVKLSTPTDKGDSGAPHYHEYHYNMDKYAAIIAPHHGGGSVGCGAYAIHDAHGYEFII